MAKIKCICIVCENEFFEYPSSIKVGMGKYCSKKCFLKLKGKVKCICIHCGKEFFKQPSVIRNGGGKYCSNRCKEVNKRVKLVCNRCGKVFIKSKSTVESGRGLFCSWKCRFFIKKIIIEKDYALVPLSQGKFAKIDLDDVDKVKDYNWIALKDKYTFYAKRTEGRKHIYMHNVIMNMKESGKIDHISRDGLDNRKQNLRVATLSQNNANKCKINKNTTSVYKGVTKRTSTRWESSMKCNYKYYYLGSFNNDIEAAKVYDRKASELFGEFAYLNFPKEDYGIR